MGFMSLGGVSQSSRVFATLGVFVLFALSFGSGIARAGDKAQMAPMAPPPGPTVWLTITPNSSPSYVAPASVNVSVEAYDDNGYDITQIKLYKNNVLVTTASSSFLDTTLDNLSAGTYTIRATATSEVGGTGSKSQSIVIQQPQITGGISGSPNPCTIPWGGSTCTSTVTWNSNAADAQVFVSLLDNSNMQLFASGQSGSTSAPWIDQSGRRFHLKSGTTTLATTDIGANPTVNSSPSVSLTAPGNGQTFTVNNALTLSANASDPDDGVQRVEFYVDGGKVGEDTTAPYAMSWATGALGAHTVMARAFDTRGSHTDSASAGISIVSNVFGYVDGVSSGADGIYRITGWACSTGLNQSIDVHLYLGGAAGSGTGVGAYTANQASEAGVANACLASGANYRFSIPLTEAVREQYAGQGIYVHGISPVGGANNLLNQSGTFTIPPPTRASTFVSQSVPTTMVMGQSYAVSVQMKNTGTATWSEAESYRLGSKNPLDNGTWGTGRIPLGGSVASGQIATFNVTVTAPTTPGTYNFQWGMVQDGVAWFGATTPNVAVTVAPPPPPAPPTTTDSKTEVIEYYDDTTKWVLGQQKKLTVNNIVVSEVTFNANAQPETIKSFGKLQQTLTYYADGTVATVKDGNNNVTTLSNWKRGIPQAIQYPATPESPAGAIESATVNDNGWITSVTDENGYVTGYGYDAIGRLASIVYPTGDSVAWNTTTQVFEPVATAEYGIAAGHWRQTVTTGNAKKITYYDALWRPLVTREYDTANEAGTTRFQRFTYDHEGRTTFASYPGTTDALTTGTWTNYDPLGRVTSVGQDTELNPSLQVTTTTYQTGFKTLVRDPKGNETTTSYQTFDQPSYDAPVVINHPEAAVTEIYRDVFGKPTNIVRRSSDNGLRVERRYVYDGYQQLCKSIEPESGATVLGYDWAGNLTKSASGLQGYMDVNSCNHPEAWASGRAVDRTYDARNRLSTLSFPDGRGNQAWNYTPDGLPSQITSYNDANNGAVVVNTYTYNRRRLLTAETSSQPGWYTWGLGYGYTSNGQLASQSYPTGLVVTYNPNALGQPTQVTDTGGQAYASGISYYPNGAIKQFTYGNGIVHSMIQNARQLPQRTSDLGGPNTPLDYQYAYDANANSTGITDLALGTNYNRTMTYDGLDRLLTATSTSFGGDGVHRFTYDTLDNLKSWKLAGGKDYADYVYDASNRLVNIKNSANATIVGLGYDAQGNLANKNGQLYTFDYGNRLRDTVGKENYRYDGQGRRVLEANPGGGFNVLTVYSRSGQMLYRADGKTNTNSEHVYLGGSLVAIRQRAADDSVAIKYQHTDALGSPVAASNQAAQVIERTQWEPYGAAIGKPNYDGVGYTGHVMDGATGLTYMQQRYYDPMIGRMLSRDPVTAYSMGDMRLFNAYAYAFNNPYRFSDPDGRIAGEQQKPDGRDDPPKDFLETVANRIQEIVNTPAPPNWPLAGDVFTTAEVDATFMAGPEVGIGQVLDLDDPLASGLYFSYATGQGANVGAALGLGYVTGDIEGKGAAIDVNAGQISPTVMLDDKGNFHGAALSAGPGAGISGSVGKTWTLSVRDVLNKVKSLIEK